MNLDLKGISSSLYSILYVTVYILAGQAISIDHASCTKP